MAVVRGLSRCGSRAPELRLSSRARELSCFVACGVFLDQGLNPCAPHRHVGFPFTAESPGEPLGGCKFSEEWRMFGAEHLSAPFLPVASAATASFPPRVSASFRLD